MNILPICDEQQYIFEVNEAIKSIPMKITYSMEFTRSYSVEELSAAVDQCIRTADVFAASCIVKDGRQYMEFMPYQKPDLPVYDFSSKEEFQLFFSQVNTNKINNRDKLYNIFLYSVAGSYYHICFRFNHLILDGISVLLLSERIQKALSEPKEEIIWHPYSAYLSGLCSYRESPKYLEDAMFWENRFLELSKCHALFGEAIATKESTIRESSFRTTEKHKEELMKFCSENNIKVYCLIASVFAQYMSEKTGSRRFCIEIPIANRLGTNDKNSLGLYEVSLPYIFDFNQFHNLRDLLESVQRQSFEYYKHSKYDWNRQTISEEFENKYGRYVPQVTLSYFCMNKRPSYSLATLNYHHCETDLLPMTIYIADFSDWRTMTYYYMYWENYFTEQEVRELHRKIENQLEVIIHNNGW